MRVPTCRECGHPNFGWLPALTTPKWLLMQASWWLAAMAGIAWWLWEASGEPVRWWWFLLLPPAMAASLFLAVFGGATLEALEEALLRRRRCSRCGSPLG